LASPKQQIQQNHHFDFILTVRFKQVIN